jgi:hypothetical protein
MVSERDRTAALLASSVLNGIDFVEVASPDQLTLRVHFQNPVAVQGTLTAAPTIAGGDVIRTVAVRPVTNADWSTDAAGRPVLTMHADAPGDFSYYTLTLASPALDPYFMSSKFTFKALCPFDLDCAPDAPTCPVHRGETPPIDYLAKDFLSFRKALSDFSALRYPAWAERSEADFGMMFMEALSSVADDLSYTQDRISAELTLDTATQRQSVVRLARLVDYEPRPATASRVLLQLDVAAAPVPAGLPFSAPDPAGEQVEFETGTGLRDTSSYPTDPRWNRGIRPYYWNDSQRCLVSGSLEMWVLGHGLGLQPGQQLLIDTEALSPADPPFREVVQLVSVAQELDQLFPGPPNPPTQVTHIRWRPQDALRFDHDLTEVSPGKPRTVLAGNLVPATQGRRVIETFAAAAEVPPATPPTMPQTFVRLGANSGPDFDTPSHQLTLRAGPLAWLAPEQPDPALDDSATWPLPEVTLAQRPSPPATAGPVWTWRRRLIDAERFESAYTVEASRFRSLGSNSDRSEVMDYADDRGETLRFGDGVFGEIPDGGAVFDVTYRVGGGTRGNVAADSIIRVGPEAASLVIAVSNPFPALGGSDAETAEQVRRRAPDAFRARQFRAVRAADYRSAAEGLAWVQRAGTNFAWTGSWLTVFTTADPRGSEALAVGQHRQLIELLNRRRLAGYESYVPAPRYVHLDLIVTVCATPDAFRGDVEAAVLRALSTARELDGETGFFHPDNWTFGQPLERARLAAAIQEAYGVAGVVSLRYRRRASVPAYLEMPDAVEIGAAAILQLDNDPNRPERGSLKVLVEGGK